MDSDYGFAGLFHDLPSGLDLAMFRDYSPTLGRWLNRDPIGEAGGQNMYSYVGNNPLTWFDSLGLYGEVTVNGNDVTIKIPIQYHGPGVTADVIKTFGHGIRERWSGKFGKYNVKTFVVPRGPVSACGKTNTITVPSGSGRSFVWGLGGSSGKWFPSNPAGWVHDEDWVAAHEAGHLMGLGDEYTDVGGVSQPHPGFEHNIMGAHGGTPSETDITNIIQTIIPQHP